MELMSTNASVRDRVVELTTAGASPDDILGAVRLLVDETLPPHQLLLSKRQSQPLSLMPRDAIKDTNVPSQNTKVQKRKVANAAMADTRVEKMLTAAPKGRRFNTKAPAPSAAICDIPPDEDEHNDGGA